MNGRRLDRRSAGGGLAAWYVCSLPGGPTECLSGSVGQGGSVSDSFAREGGGEIWEEEIKEKKDSSGKLTHPDQLTHPNDPMEDFLV